MLYVASDLDKGKVYGTVMDEKVLCVIKISKGALKYSKEVGGRKND